MEGLSQHRYKWKLRLVAIFIHKTCSSQTVKTLTLKEEQQKTILLGMYSAQKKTSFKKSVLQIYLLKRNKHYVHNWIPILPAPKATNIVIFLCHDFTLPTYYPFFECWIFILFVYGSIVAAQYYTSYRCTVQWFTIFKGYPPPIVIIKYCLYSACCRIYPSSLFYT